MRWVMVWAIIVAQTVDVGFPPGRVELRRSSGGKPGVDQRELAVVVVGPKLEIAADGHAPSG